MIRAHSQRLLQPYSAQVQIAESEHARALSTDGDLWEFQFIYAQSHRQDGSGPRRGRFVRAAHIRQCDLKTISENPSTDDGDVDHRILELATFLLEARLPFAAADRYEYWLLDPTDDSPLALIFSCVHASEMASFPRLTEWTALPAAVMPIATSEVERSRSYGPVNYRLERCVAERAGTKPRAQWFTRGETEGETFPPFLIREDWPSEEHQDLCQRYLHRQAPRLLMLHGVSREDRRRMELAAKANALDVARFYPLYPDIADSTVMDNIRVEARLRMAAGERPYVMGRRDGVLYQ
ncbi:hypothetical protein CKO25_15680 [Thiocapsa imhoffii]|uniref:Uncharacterized protein n=1 Tax=Thiocapsa imhoffii TaxID=382777 RepID=A0A9X0WKA3_9GAMM|nr:hypothetical protein [Thiocapsa imhoffii]MBK1646060.1 hypothetical protein [Thiocapsa imhoffii]